MTEYEDQYTTFLHGWRSAEVGDLLRLRYEYGINLRSCHPTLVEWHWTLVCVANALLRERGVA